MSNEDVDRELHNAAAAAWCAGIAAKIAKYGIVCIGVFGTEDDPGPPFTYTIGMSPVLGYELIICGLRHEYALTLLNDIHHRVKTVDDLKLDVQDSRWANLPVVFKQATKTGTQYAFQAAQYYSNDDLNVVQIVLPDAKGKFPWDEGFDQAYMGPRQTLLF